MSVRAKFVVHEITQRMQSVPTNEKDERGYTKYVQKPVDVIRMAPVMGEENQRFWTASPSGSLEIACTNPEATGQFKLGESYYVDFTPAPPTEP